VNRFKLEPGERVLCSNAAIWIRSWWRRPHGRLTFTTQRLAFELDRTRTAHPGFAAIEELREHLPIDVGRDRLVTVSLVQVKRRTDLVVKTDYETFAFATLPNDDWYRTMHDAIEADRSALAELVQRLEAARAPGPSDDPYRGGPPKR
jgi:hypothetical protein